MGERANAVSNKRFGVVIGWGKTETGMQNKIKLDFIKIG